ncbi:MAG: type II toxin-antitoxin system VapC family toxin, partial [Desulfobacterales bacterium]|nr:type II toxin-antitoxin system VapC family toxin [Desulfobacterales bacterium]
MNNIVLIDTDVLIDFIHGKDEAKSAFLQIEQNFSISISVITKMELFIGCRNKSELKSIEKFLSQFQLIELTKHISKSATDLLHQYHLSHGLLIADALIASTAIQMNLALLSK